MFEYIFTIGCFDKFHKGHIKLLESMKKETNKIIVGIYTNKIISIKKNISDVYSYDSRKKCVEEYSYDTFMIDDVDPTKAIQEYILNHITNKFNKVDEISKSLIYQNKGKIKLLTDNFNLYGAPGNYLSNQDFDKYRNNITLLPIGTRAKHFYEDNEYRIYNERDKKIGQNLKYGTLIFSRKELSYQCEEFNDTLNNKVINGGSEDNRYIIFKDDLYVVFNGVSKKDNSRQMFLYNIKKSKLCQLYINNYDISKIIQKNWMPYIYEDSLYFIYSICELCILKVISTDTGECNIVFGDPSKFTDKGLFGGSNLCHWRKNLYIGFLHSRNPHLCMPFLYDAKNYKYISTYSPIDFNLPFKINHKVICGTEEFPYYFRKISNKYELFLSYQVICSIKYEITTNAIDTLFTNLLYYKNWCFMRANDNKNFPGIDFIKSIMPIQYLPYSKEISASKLRDYKNNKVGVMNYLLHKVVDIMNENNIPYYLDCGTLLGCIRDNEIMEKDTDLDIAIHLSYWNKLNDINFNNYGLTRTRTLNGFPNKPYGNMISVKTKYHDIYCDIYAQPSFPLLTTKILNGNEYNIPIHPKLFLEVLFDKNWRIPSNIHSNQKNHRGNGLVNSKYFKYWDKKYEIIKCKF